MKLCKLIAGKFIYAYISILWKVGWIPLLPSMGAGKYQSIPRYYVDQFIYIHLNEMKGDLLEIGRKIYGHLALPDIVNSYTCLDIENYPDIDLIADIQHMPQVSSNSFDSIICTQVLEHIPNPFTAVNELYRILRIDGKLFLTVPFLNNIHMEPHDYWRFTEYSLMVLLSSFKQIDIHYYGSTYEYIMAVLGFHSRQIAPCLKPVKSEFPVIVTAVAQK